MSNKITRGLNRAERRKMNAKQVNEAKENTQNQLAAMLLSVWIDVIWDDVEEIVVQDWVTRVVERYNEIDDFEAFQKQVYEKTGIGILRTEDLGSQETHS